MFGGAVYPCRVHRQSGRQLRNILFTPERVNAALT